MTRYRRSRWKDGDRQNVYRVRERRGHSYFQVAQWRAYFEMMRKVGR